MAISSKALLAVLALSGEERHNLAEALQDETITTAERFSSWLSQALQDETRKQGEENRKQAEELKAIPAGVWAAHALEGLSELIYNLSVIREAAEKTELTKGADSYAEEGRYIMLLEAVAGIAGRMMDIITDQSAARDVLQIVAEETEKPAED